MFEDLRSDLRNKMDKVIQSFQSDLKSVRTGRASPNLLDNINVEAYGNMSPLTQVASVSLQDSQLLVVQVWDSGLVKNVEKAINISNLGVTASADGQLVRVPIPPLSEERRKDMAKLLAKYSEQSKIAIRNIRRDGMDVIKKMEKDSEISKDDSSRGNDLVQKMTDDYTAKINHLLSEREKEIMKI
ncbi:MAG: ribosome recycling factor [Alphaproteobacteria bacterium]|nr:ribosome recycling factor [Alphaproteobacteria bacterium]